ncbi:AAA family ATPase [Marinobacterium sediminicola]|uniref:ATP-dependent Zn proteases n=1 Tax=Marinobacterium sediminicola TaxID=518898 RepID=A0ABY1RWK3_9GAMM|nr:AAA family ATPase [Marinobacterium sediminicola]ULG70323.1 AAA family ATPase [Marinobacterium sediminicola]SMR69723.1 ATP-dependent Zn proteases [Marinobacterium sediminicola]
MRNTLLGGKLLAMESGEALITLDHLRRALQFLQPVSASQYALLCDALNVPEQASQSERFTAAMLEETASLPRLPYSPDVITLLNALKRKGLDLSSTVTEPFVNLSARKGRYHSVISSVAELKALLNSRIFDQDAAVEAVSDAVMRMSWSELSDRPQAIFSFLGPAATGKTYMAQLMGQGLQGYALRSFDMTQFASEKESFGLVGLRKGFSDATTGLLTDFVKQNPRSIIVFDELEKSHSRVQTALLRMLSEGRLRDEYSGEEIDFRQTIVVVTSNLGSSIYSNRTFAEQARKQPHQAREHLLQAIRQETKIEDGHQVAAIPPEMISRLSQGSIILFNKLSIDALARIAQEQIQQERKSFEDKLGLSVEFSRFDALVRLLVLGFAPEFDTRAVKSRLSEQVYDPITDYLLAHQSAEVERVELSVDDSVTAFLQSQDMNLLPQQLATKHQRVYFQRQLVLEGQALKVLYTDVRVEKLARGEDFMDASGIQVDLPEVSFEQIAGHLQIKARLSETINLVCKREQLKAQGVSTPRGMLLYGVPGTGKTMLAKAFAHEAQLPFIACTGNDLLNESFIRKLFARAREYAPAIIFIDEIDALPRRGTAGPQADALVNRMLVEIDGFGGGDDVFVIAATNRKDLIDPAILRSGRIDLHFEVPQLDKDARRWFIERMLTRPLFSSGIDVDQLVMLTAGFSGADLQKVSREVVLLALREGLEQIGPELVIEQVNTQKYGAPLTLEDGRQHLLETAYHEAAHAVISRVLLPERRIEQVTVVARANFLGMVAYDNEQEHDYTRDFLFNLTCVALAGRAAQVKQFGNKGLDSGAAGDLKQAASYAWHAIAEWGMDDQLYNLSIPTLKERLKRLPFAARVEDRIKHWLDEATACTASLVDTHWQQIDRVAQRVLSDEIIDAATLNQLME